MPQTFTVGSRSLFVTLTAWVSIFLAALAGASTLVQNTAVAPLLASLLASVLPGLNLAIERNPLPLVTGLLLGYLPWVVGAALVVALATLGSAVGLLVRLDWARRSFIGLLVVAILANLFGLWLQHEVVDSVLSHTLHDNAISAQALSVFGGFVTLTRVLALLMTVLACALLGWMIRRLMSAGVRQEFA